MQEWRRIYSPEDDISFFKRSVLLDPWSQAFTDPWILIRELSSRKILIWFIRCNPQIMLQKSSPSQKLGFWTCQRQAVRTRYQLVPSQLPSPIYSSCIFNLNNNINKFSNGYLCLLKKKYRVLTIQWRADNGLQSRIAWDSDLRSVSCV